MKLSPWFVASIAARPNIVQLPLKQKITMFIYNFKNLRNKGEHGHQSQMEHDCGIVLWLVTLTQWQAFSDVLTPKPYF